MFIEKQDRQTDKQTGGHTMATERQTDEQSGTQIIKQTDISRTAFFFFFFFLYITASKKMQIPNKDLSCAPVSAAFKEILQTVN